ncbi:MAG: ABC transporter ATP-binding protein [Rhodanobacteraceae bacterium]
MTKGEGRAALTTSAADSGATAPARAARTDSLLELRQVHVRLGGSHILQGIDFAVPENGVTALLGRNGVGKTTTLRAILGIVPHVGSIRFAGESLDALPTHRIVQQGIAYVPEDRDVFAGLTVAENLRLAERRGIRPDYERVFELFADLRERRRQLAGTLSGGQQQMLSLARALLNPNRLLLIDEPTKGLSPLLVTQTAVALQHMAQHTTMLLVEQNLGAVRRLATHAVVIADGRVAFEGGAAEFLGNAQLTRRLLGVAAGGADPKSEEIP